MNPQPFLRQRVEVVREGPLHVVPKDDAALPPVGEGGREHPS
jgi:hypothetical protein